MFMYLLCCQKFIYGKHNLEPILGPLGEHAVVCTNKCYNKVSHPSDEPFLNFTYAAYNIPPQTIQDIVDMMAPASMPTLLLLPACNGKNPSLPPSKAAPPTNKTATPCHIDYPPYALERRWEVGTTPWSKPLWAYSGPMAKYLLLVSWKKKYRTKYSQKQKCLIDTPTHKKGSPFLVDFWILENTVVVCSTQPACIHVVDPRPPIITNNQGTKWVSVLVSSSVMCTFCFWTESKRKKVLCLWFQCSYTNWTASQIVVQSLTFSVCLAMQ